MSLLPGIPGVYVGHAQHPTSPTGCSVILCPGGAVGGVDVRGAAPGTRETDLLAPGNLVDRVNAVLLTGGSAFGLAAADGVVRWLYERGYGFPTPAAPVPIVPAAVLYDLRPGAVAWPDADAGYAACEAASHETLWGRVGAGTGASVGILLGDALPSPGGIGLAARTLPDGYAVVAVVAVNSFGSVLGQDGGILAGTRGPDGSFYDPFSVIGAAGRSRAGQNTTIGCVVTTAPLDPAGCRRVASMAHDGLARAIVPAHTQFDGDTLFALSAATPDAQPADLTYVGVVAADLVAEAIRAAVRS